MWRLVITEIDHVISVPAVHLKISTSVPFSPFHCYLCVQCNIVIAKKIKRTPIKEAKGSGQDCVSRLTLFLVSCQFAVTPHFNVVQHMSFGCVTSKYDRC